jgi:glycosyltransferase involved in cell wall biosynthesis
MESPQVPSVTVVIPAYNEENGIADVVREVRALPLSLELIVVDDGSDDATADRAACAGARVIRHRVNRGYGAALKTGISAARCDHVVITDADGTYPNERIPELVALLAENDMVVGARIGRKVSIPVIRRPAKWMLNRLADYLSESRIPDLNSGLRAFHRDRAIEFFGILPRGFSFTTTITLAMHVNDRPVTYVPIDYHPRTGRSKIRPFHDTLNFAGLIVRTVLYFRPLKIFVPLAFFFFLLSIAILFYSWRFTPKIMDASVVITLMTSFQMLAIGLLADLIDKRSFR